MPPIRSRLVRPLALAAALALMLSAQGAAAQELPRTRAPRPTVPEISASDLMSRLYALADDSMMGRGAGTVGNFRATAYVAAEFARMGLEPAGENGTYFQTIPLRVRTPDPEGNSLSAGGTPLAVWTDFAPLPSVPGFLPVSVAFSADALPVVYGGQLGGTTIAPEQAAGKLVVLGAAPGISPDREMAGALRRYRTAAAVAMTLLDVYPEEIMDFVREQRPTLLDPKHPEPANLPAGLLLTGRAAEALMGAPLAGLRPGAAGRTAAVRVRFAESAPEAPARNVVAILRGSDPRLRNEYVAIGAHNDHIGLQPPVDHDSLRAFNAVMAPEGVNSNPGEPTPQQWARIRATLDSLRRVRPARLDSIANGADDDGSGTVTLLEIAEQLASASPRPRRSILFVSHTGEELGLFGSQYFTDNPTVPRDSIVTQLNMDMVGRGRAEDVKGGGPRSIQMIGSRRLATELGDSIDALNRRRAQPMVVDYSFDAPGHPYNRYCRSDHYMYARYGIPITYFSAGYHRDYHMVTDEPQYIDYDHMALIGGFVRDIAVTVADMSHRPVVDHPKPDPNGGCRQ